MAKDHDIIIRDAEGNVSRIAKGEASEARPHAASCVGCRREGVCIGCGEKTTIATGKCTSGACRSCCYRVHRHPAG
jgi:hypothetical protein